MIYIYFIVLTLTWYSLSVWKIIEPLKAYQECDRHLYITILGGFSGIVFKNGKTDRWLQAEKACTWTWNNRNLNSSDWTGQNCRGLPKGSSRASKLDRTVGTYYWANAASWQRNGSPCGGLFLFYLILMYRFCFFFQLWWYIHNLNDPNL